MKDSAQYLKLQLQNCHRGGRFGRSSISMFVKPQAKNEENKRFRRTSEVTDVDDESWRSGCCKEKRSISLQIAAVPSAAMVRVGLSRWFMVVFRCVINTEVLGSTVHFRLDNLAGLSNRKCSVLPMCP